MKEIEKIEASIYLYNCLKEVLTEYTLKFMKELKNKFKKSQILDFDENEIREIYIDSRVTPGIYLKFNEIKIEDKDYYFTLKIEIDKENLAFCFGFDAKIKKEEISSVKLKDMRNISKIFFKNLTDLESKLRERGNKFEIGNYAIFLNLDDTNFRKVSTTDNKFLINLLEDDTREKEVDRVYKKIDNILDIVELKKPSKIVSC